MLAHPMANKDNDGFTGSYYSHPESSTDFRCSSCICDLFKIFLTFLLLLAVLALAAWLILRPNRLVVYAENASLSRFDLTPDGRSVIYDLSVTFSVRNPNRVAFYYDRLEATASYNGSRFGYDYGTRPFLQDQKNTTMLRPRFSGQQAVANSSVIDALAKDKGKGWFEIQVKIDAKVRMKIWHVKTNKYSPSFTCDIRLPAASTANATGFTSTECNVDYF